MFRLVLFAGGAAIEAAVTVPAAADDQQQQPAGAGSVDGYECYCCECCEPLTRPDPSMTDAEFDAWFTEAPSWETVCGECQDQPAAVDACAGSD